MNAGWLDDFTAWILRQIEKVWDMVVEFVHDFFVFVIDAIMSLFSTLVESIPLPDFLQNVSLGYFLSQLPPGVQWFMDVTKIPEGLALLAAGVAFRLLRKLVTLGQW